VRRIYQAFFLALFLAALLLMTAEGIHRLPVAWLFQLDPLSAAVALLASWSLTAALAWSLAVVALTVLAGRAFCGWICPLGTLLQLASWATRRLRRGPATDHNRWRPHFALKYLLLAALLARGVIALAPRLDLRDENAALLLLGLVLLALGAARMFGASTLLVPLAAGVLLRNASPRPWLWPRHFGTAGGVLVVMLFVIVGASWSLPVLAAGAAVALAVLGARATAKAVAVVALSPWSGVTARQGACVALGLLPVSAVALVLLNDLQAVAGDAASRVGAVVLAAIVLAELFGPLAVQGALALAREQATSANDGQGRP